VGDFGSLKVWHKAHRLTLAVYRSTSSFPDTERFGLTSQARRAAASIPANLAEGSARGTDGDFARFVRISLGSAAELEYHLLLAADLGYLRHDTYEALRIELSEIKRMLTGLISHLSAPGEGRGS
jgi:four helix bundle protein